MNEISIIVVGNLLTMFIAWLVHAVIEKIVRDFKSND